MDILADLNNLLHGAGYCLDPGRGALILPGGTGAPAGRWSAPPSTPANSGFE